MATKKIVPQSSPVSVASCEAALSGARAAEAEAQKALLAADPSEVIACRDRALVCEAAVRRATEALDAAKKSEADRDRAARMSTLEGLTDDEREVIERLTSAAHRVVECEALLEQARAAAKTVHEQIDGRREQAKKLATSLGVPVKVPRAARYFRSQSVPGTAHPNTGEAGLYPAMLAIVQRDAGRISENECARRVCWATGTFFPKGEKPCADPNKPSEGTLRELRDLGITDRQITDLALSGVLACYYSERRSALEAFASGTARHNAHRALRTAELFVSDLREAFKAGNRLAREITEQISAEGAIERDAIRWEHVQQILKAMPRGALATSLGPSERALFAGPQPPAPANWDPRACLERLGAFSSEAAE